MTAEQSGFHKSITIRGHHLRNLSRFLEGFATSSLTPEDYSEQFVAGELRKALYSSSMDRVSTSKYALMDYESGMAYQKDLFGDDLEGKDDWAKELTKWYLRILALPDDYSIEVVVGMDDMCMMCKNGITPNGLRLGGEHCVRSIESFGDREVLLKEFPKLDITEGGVIKLGKLKRDLLGL